MDFTCNTAKMFSFGPNPTREKKAWSSSTCLLYEEMYGIRKSEEEPLFFAVLRISSAPLPRPPPLKYSQYSHFPATSFLIFLPSVWQSEDCLILVWGGREESHAKLQKNIGLLFFLFNVVVAYVRPFTNRQSPNFLTFKEPKNRFKGISSAGLCSPAGRCDNLFLLGS